MMTSILIRMDEMKGSSYYSYRGWDSCYFDSS